MPQLKGRVHEVTPTVQVTESLKKRELIIEYIENPQYPEYLKFDAIQANCEKLDELRPGDSVEVHFNLKGRPWTDKTGKKSYFNSLQVWKVDISQTAKETNYNYAPPVDMSADDDDLPF